MAALAALAGGATAWPYVGWRSALAPDASAASLGR